MKIYNSVSDEIYKSRAQTFLELVTEKSTYKFVL